MREVHGHVRLVPAAIAVSLATIALLGVAAVACAPAPTPPLPGASLPVSDTATLVARLQDAGVPVRLLGQAEFDWFEQRGSAYEIWLDPEKRPENLYVHEYPTEQTMREELARLDRAGNRIRLADGTDMRIEWLGTPHVHAQGRLLAVYVGDSSEVAEALMDAMGPQVAGAAVPVAPDLSGATGDT
jgi:hypothetical protein